MFEMILNLLKAIGEPMGAAGGAVLGTVLLFVLVLGSVVGIGTVIGVIMSRDLNIKRRFDGIWWASYDKNSADEIARLRGRL